MTWVRIDDQMPDHPKVAGLTSDAFRLHITGLCYASRHLTDGDIPRAMIDRWGVRHADRAAHELCSAGLWVEIPTGWRIHDYLEHQRSKAQVEELAEKRRTAGRKGGRPKATPEADRKQIASSGQSKTESPPNPEDRGQRTETDIPLDDDNFNPSTPDPSSSSDDPHWPVWMAFARAELAERATPPDHEANWLTGVARTARRERGGLLARLTVAYPDAGPGELARLLRDGHEPPAPARSWSCDCGVTVEGLDAWQDHLAVCDDGMVPASSIEVRS